jgi:hypothetical protein
VVPVYRGTPLSMRADRFAVAVEEGRGGRYTLSRRGGRVVECGGLENRYVGNPGVGGSNPPLSAAAGPVFGFRCLA